MPSDLDKYEDGIDDNDKDGNVNDLAASIICEEG